MSVTVTPLFHVGGTKQRKSDALDGISGLGQKGEKFHRTHPDVRRRLRHRPGRQGLRHGAPVWPSGLSHGTGQTNRYESELPFLSSGKAHNRNALFIYAVSCISACFMLRWQ